MLTVDDLRQHIESDKADAALQLLLNAAYETIDAYLGIGSGDDVRELLTAGPGDLLMLSRKAASITSVKEWAGDASELTLEADDYDLVDRQLLRRLATGTNPSHVWRNRVEPTYAPMEDSARRDAVAIDLVRIDLDLPPGLVSQKLGEWSETYAQGAGASKVELRAGVLAALSDGFLLI